MPAVVVNSAKYQKKATFWRGIMSDQRSSAPLNSPVTAEVEAGKTYQWCACGKSKSQPFCDGSHQGSEFEPLVFTAEKTGVVTFCGCKQSRNGALCDGSHKRLRDFLAPAAPGQTLPFLTGGRKP